MLKIKAITKIRAYVLEQISKLRKPMTNYHMPQNALLKHKYVTILICITILFIIIIYSSVYISQAFLRIFIDQWNSSSSRSM